MKKIIVLVAVLCLQFGYSQAQIQIGQDIDGEAAYDRAGYSVCMPDAHTVAVGAPLNNGNGYWTGHVRIYSITGNVWLQKGQDIEGDTLGDHFGSIVYMPDANTIATGTEKNQTSTQDLGYVKIYVWNGTQWKQKGENIYAEALGDRFSSSITMPDSNTIAIGAIYNDGSTNYEGHVRIYTWNGNTWVQKGTDIDGEGGGDYSGGSVSMPDANTVAIGASNNNGNGTHAGHVRIFVWDGNAWAQKGTDIDGEASGDYSGSAVSMPDANTVAIGADRNSGNGTYAGHVRIYTWNGNAWVQKGTDIDGEAIGDYSGSSVIMSDVNTVAIGAYKNDGNGAESGHVRIYTWNGTDWVQIGGDIDGEAAGDRSGEFISMPDTNTIAIGSWANDGNGTDAGHVRVFKLNGITNIRPYSPIIGIDSKEFNIYPNPASSKLTVSIDASIPQHDSNVEIYNAIGVVVKHLILNPSPREKDLFVVVDIADLPKGMYLVKCGAEAVKLVVE